MQVGFLNTAETKMDNDLKKLMKRMPPPADPPMSRVDWKRLEAAIQISYPTSFKEFIGAYGGSVWCDNFSPFCSEAKSDRAINSYLQTVNDKIGTLRSMTMYDADANEIHLPLYPEPGGLFPFMIDYSSSIYCWKTDRKSSNEWPIVCWFTGNTVILEQMTISKMFLDWLERKPKMRDVWGDVNDLPLDRLCLSTNIAHE
jgi:hypothetical protein